MSQLQAESGNDNKTRPTNAVKAGYWPGHVIAETLIDDTDPNDSVFIDKHTSTNTSHQAKSRAGSDHSNGDKSNRKSSKNSINNGEISNDTNKKISTCKIRPGAAFSAIINSMLPLNIINKAISDPESKPRASSQTSQNNQDDLNEDEHSFVYDEFGFRMEIDDLSNEDSEKQAETFVNISLSACPNPEVRRMLTNEPFVEDSKHKLKWIAYLEFTINADIGSSFSWDKVLTLNRCEKLRAMIRGQGIPHSLRPFIWMRLSGALQKKLNSKFNYSEILKNFQHDQFHTSKQIEKDLLRTLPTNACFYQMNSVGIPRLRRILQSIAWLYPNIGYCQGMGTIVATLLLFLEEEDAFWVMCAIVEDILPASYYSHTLLGVQADMKVLSMLIATYLPEVDQQLKKHDIELSLVVINWFLTIFSNVLHIRILLRIWDLFFYDGSTAIFQITLALLKLNELAILSADSSSQIFQILTDIPGEVCDIDLLIETSIRVASSVNKNLLDASRKKHQAYLMAQNGSIINPSNYQNLPLSKEKSQRLKLLNEKNGNNLFKMFKKQNSKKRADLNNNSSYAETSDTVKSVASHSTDDADEVKMKNILQTEFLVNLREIILKIAHHFQTSDPEKYFNCDLNADYSVESHSRDYEVYMDTSKAKQFKRAKALLDFEKTDEDELGKFFIFNFAKNSFKFTTLI